MVTPETNESKTRDDTAGDDTTGDGVERKRVGLAAGLPAEVADLRLVFSSSRQVGGTEAPGIERWTVEAVSDPMVQDGPGRDRGAATASGVATTADGGRVGVIRVLVIDLLRCPDPWGALDSSNDTIAHIGEIVFDPNTGQLAEGLDSRLERVGQRVLVLDRVELEPAWRGHNVAALLTAEALDQLSAGCRVALCLPGPLDRSGLSAEDYDDAVRRMQAVWEQVGFRPYEEGVWLLQPHQRTRQDHLMALRARHGVADPR